MFRSLMFVLIALCLVLGTLPGSAADSRPLIAVLPFDDGSIKHWWGNDWDVGKGVADLIVNDLLDGGKFRLVERSKIAQIIEEQNFGASGRVDPKTASKIGKIAGVKYMVMGKVTEFTVSDMGGSLGGVSLKTSTARVSIDGRLIDTTTAEILAGAKGVAEKKTTGGSISLSSLPDLEFGSDRFEETILGKAASAAVAAFCTDLEGKFGGTGAAASAATAAIKGKVATVSGGKVYLNIGSKDGVKVGMVFVIERVTEEVKDPDTGEVLDVVTDKVCEIKIVEVKEMSSNGTVTTGKTPGKGDLATQKI